MRNKFLLLGLLPAGCSIFGKGSEERPSYQVVLKADNKEIRKYDSYIIAKTAINGQFKEAQSKGFRILAGYIFGKNKSEQSISLTAPVVMSPLENKSWAMSFSMPSKYTLNTLPVPNDERVELEVVKERLVAAITYSGFWGESRNEEESKKLQEWLKSHQDYEVISAPMFAGYNPPWTIPFLRRNEILIELRRK